MSDYTESLSFRIDYADGEEVSGRHCKDTLHWAGLEVPECIFAQVTHLGSYQMCIAEDGIFGLAYSALNSHDFKSPFQNVADSGIISNDKTIFSFYLHPDDNYDDDDTLVSNGKSQLIVGGVDRSLYSECLKWLDVPQGDMGSVGFWEFPVSKVQVGEILNSSITLEHDIHAILDSGSTDIVGPATAISRFVDYNNATCYEIDFAGDLEERSCRDDSFFGGWDIATVPCDEPLQPLEFVTTEMTFSFGYDELVYSLNVTDELTNEDVEICIFKFTPDFASLGGNQWVLGDTFLQKYYAAFDWTNRRIGFAPSILNDGVSSNESHDLCADDADLDIHFNDDSSSPPPAPAPVTQSTSNAPVEDAISKSPAPSNVGSILETTITPTQSPVTRAPILTSSPVVGVGASNDDGPSSASSVAPIFMLTIASVSILVGLVFYFRRRRSSGSGVLIRGQMLPTFDMDSGDHEII